jgi:hypothetical protein
MRNEVALPTLVLPALLLAGCSVDESPTAQVVADGTATCSLPLDEVFDGGPGKDGIPALVDPELFSPQSVVLSYLEPDDRVIGVILDGQPIAVPLNVGWWHEIVNLDYGGMSVAITHCPLTGSSLVFDRKPIGGASFGVSGLLYRNNLIMYDRTTMESLWPQMIRGARCGDHDGTALDMVPAMEMTWAGWSALHFNTLVVAGDDRFGRDYRRYPYGNYDQVGNNELLFPIDRLDRRRPLKERVLGIPNVGDGGVAFPFGALSELGDIGAVEYDTADGPILILWNRFHQTAGAFVPVVDGVRLDIEVDGPFFVDDQTGSQWNVDGQSRAGELFGKRLEPVAEAYVAFWFAWAAFHPDTELWTEASQ